MQPAETDRVNRVYLDGCVDNQQFQALTMNRDSDREDQNC